MTVAAVEELRMKLSRFERIKMDLNASLSKVFDAVPAQEAWSYIQINMEISRRGRSRMEQSVLMGCIRALKDKGLVTEPMPGLFQRVAVVQKQETASAPETVPETLPQPQPMPKETPLEKIAALSAKVRAHAETFRALADDIDGVAIEVEEMFNVRDAQVEKLRQLQVLLKGLGAEA
jgi:hypothetical protein